MDLVILEISSDLGEFLRTCNLGDVVYMVNMVSLVIQVTLVENYLRSPCNAI